MICNGKTKQHRQIRCSGLFWLFRCSGVPGYSAVFRCSGPPGFSTCRQTEEEYVREANKLTIKQVVRQVKSKQAIDRLFSVYRSSGRQVDREDVNDRQKCKQAGGEASSQINKSLEQKNGFYFMETVFLFNKI